MVQTFIQHQTGYFLTSVYTVLLVDNTLAQADARGSWNRIVTPVQDKVAFIMYMHVLYFFLSQRKHY